jgi:XTP/dITP diphosphohydrolase
VSRRLLLATRNEHKRREFARLLPGLEVEKLPEEVTLPREDGQTFAENALGKARAAARATGRATIADDSGIEAAALGGAPGVRSARYAGEEASDEENLAKLLREAPAGSGLEYVCVIAYVDPSSGQERLFEGRCSGRVAERPRGEGGFGYDPAFVPDDDPQGELRHGELPQDELLPDELRQGQRPQDARLQDVSARTQTTMAELSDEQKDAISHRGRAARALLVALAAPTAG